MIDWEEKETNGAHIFSATRLVRHNDGREGCVLEHSTLQARIMWTDGTIEIIEQHDPEVWVICHGRS